MKLKLIFSLLASTSALAAKPESISSYLEIQTKLSADSISGIAEIASKISHAEKGSKTAEISKKLSQSKSIADAREIFKTLSNEIIATTNKKDLGELKIAACPMAKAKWIQKGSEIKNPYYGSSMLECGSVEE